jgi:tRNA (guanosine-2'-O-)-methyltransferase
MINDQCSMINKMNDELITYLSQFITDNKREKMDQVLVNRTRYLTLAVEDIYQPHNASAIVRTCDCFGIQELHIIENKNKYKVNPDVTLGSSKWVDIIPYNKEENNTEACIMALKKDGYKVIATTPHKDDMNLEDLPLDQKTALLFGNEVEGLSPKAIELADGFVKIPMNGFTESLNISVSAAICIHFLTLKLHRLDMAWRLNDEERAAIKLKWIKNIVKKSDLLEKEFISKLNKL